MKIPRQSRANKTKQKTTQPTNKTKHAKESRQEKDLQTEIKVKGLAIRTESERRNITLYAGKM